MTWTRINPEDPTTYPERAVKVLFCVADYKNNPLAGIWGGQCWSANGVAFAADRVTDWQPSPALPGEEAEAKEFPAELVEMVAKAIYESDGDDLLPWSELLEGKPGEGVGRELYRHLARAAIEAIRPSPADHSRGCFEVHPHPGAGDVWCVCEPAAEARAGGAESQSPSADAGKGAE